ncbi:MAG TPA: hypothetical protein VGG89_05710 [Candidatus Baltobacteraceae bacterium]
MPMTQQQIKNVATGFVHVLIKHSEVYDAWVPVARTGDIAGIATFLQECMFLQSVPTAAEIEAMDAHLGAEMQQDVEAFRDARPDAPVVIGVCGEEHGP